MKTLDEIKEEVSKERGYADWEHCINDQPPYMIENIMDAVLKRYAQQVGQDCLNRAANAGEGKNGYMYFDSDQQAIIRSVPIFTP